MVLVSYSGKEINAKIVFYGPGLCGKTTNLEYIYGSIPSNSRGKMVSMKTKTERTLFFDFLPLNLGELAGFKTRFLLYTVPGQVYYNATRKLVLKGVDAVIFVADSARGKMDENIESFQNLRDNLQEHGLSLGDIPYVLQYNKRDLPDVYTVEELERTLNKEGVPSFEAVATTGDGVFETFKACSKLLLAKLSKEIGAAVVSKKGAGPSAAAAARAAAASESSGRTQAPPGQTPAMQPPQMPGPPAQRPAHAPAEAGASPEAGAPPRPPSTAAPGEGEDRKGRGLWRWLRKDHGAEQEQGASEASDAATGAPSTLEREAEAPRGPEPAAEAPRGPEPTAEAPRRHASQAFDSSRERTAPSGQPSPPAHREGIRPASPSPGHETWDAAAPASGPPHPEQVEPATETPIHLVRGPEPPSQAARTREPAGSEPTGTRAGQSPSPAERPLEREVEPAPDAPEDEAFTRSYFDRPASPGRVEHETAPATSPEPASEPRPASKPEGIMGLERGGYESVQPQPARQAKPPEADEDAPRRRETLEPFHAGSGEVDEIVVPVIIPRTAIRDRVEIRLVLRVVQEGEPSDSEGRVQADDGSGQDWAASA